METIIHTIQGTYIIPKEKEAALLYWLQANAVLQGQQEIGELQNMNGQRLINEITR